METAAVKDIHFDLVELCKKGDSKAQFKLYNLYKKAMYNVCLRMVNDEDEAHDVLQETFVSAFNNLRKFEGRSSVGTWIRQIAINKALSHIKKKSGLMRLNEGIDIADCDNDISQEEILFQIENIKSAVSKLPDGFRMVLCLYLFEGYDHKEIASILGISESTSKTQYLRAKNKLLTLIKDNKVSI